MIVPMSRIKVKLEMKKEAFEMRITGLLVVTGLLMLQAGCKDTPAAAPAPHPVHRYKLVHAEHYGVYAGGGGGISRHDLFKIDEETGKTWRYVAGAEKSGNPVDEWTPIKD